MNFSNPVARVSGKARRMLATHFIKRVVQVEPPTPIVSFTFDDAPKSAFRTGHEILKHFGARATYYVSLGLLDTETEVGKIGSLDDLKYAISEGCELGCHTFGHLDAWRSPRHEFLASVEKNRRALEEMLPQARFATFAYPKSGATVWVKAALGRDFSCCRGGGQTTNAGVTDLGLLNAVFLDRRTGIDIEAVRRLIEDNAKRRGWLIFATHDIGANASQYGCAPEFLAQVAGYAQDTGARLLPVGEACASLDATMALID